MKKFLCAIAMLVAFIPFIGVKAINETTNYYSYKKGQVVNFYPNSTYEANHNKEALETIIVEDKDTSDKFIKVWSMSGIGHAAGSVYSPGQPMQDSINQYKSAFSQLNGSFFETGAANAKEGNYFLDFTATVGTEKGMNVLTLSDLETMFGTELAPVLSTTTTNDPNAALVNNVDAYTLGNAKLEDRNGTEVKLYDELELVRAVAAGTDEVMDGFYVLDDKNSTTRMMIARVHTNSAGNITSIEITPATASDSNKTYMFLPTLYANKTADCHDAPSPMCYVCTTDAGTEYKWTTDGTGCTAYPDAKTVDECKKKSCYKCVNKNGKFYFVWARPNDKKVENCEEQTEITSENDCSELVKTGVESHILEFAIVAALCVIALIVVKRKDLFKTI